MTRLLALLALLPAPALADSFVLVPGAFGGAWTWDAVVPTSSSWFDWDAPTPNGQTGADRCMWDLFECVGAGGRSVTFVNYAGF